MPKFQLILLAIAFALVARAQNAVTVEADTLRMHISNQEIFRVDGKAIFFNPANGSVCIGNNVGMSSTNGYANTAVGHNAFQNDSIGTGITAIGSHALRDNKTGQQNTALGFAALLHNQSGDANIAVGNEAQRSLNNGVYNIAIGYHSNYWQDSGGDNVSIGARANRNNQNGIQNTIIGSHAGRGGYLHSKSGNVFLGYRAGYFEYGDNKLYIENSDTLNPLIYGEFDNNLVRINGTLEATMGMSDGDGDTKIQLEKSPDDDVIRFDIAGTEQWRMTAERLEPDNSNSGIYIGKGAGGDPGDFRVGNIALGDSALAHNEDNYNVAIGYKSMLANTSGWFNTALGSSSLRSNESGAYNAALGNSALNLNTTGHDNVAVGSLALWRNTTGLSNVAVGSGAIGGFTHSGNGNTAIGRYALEDNSLGNGNVAIGNMALRSSRYKDQQVAVGDSALLANGDAFTGTTQFYNTAIGAASLATSEAGRYNTALGFHAGRNAPGSSNVFIGHQAGKHEPASHKLYISNTATSSPLVYGEFDNQLLRVNGSFETSHFKLSGPRLSVIGSGSSVFLGEFAGQNDDLSANNNVFIGRYAGQDNTSGHWSTAIGYSALSNQTTGNRNVAIGGVALRDNNGARNVAVGVDAGQANTGSQNVFIGFEAGRTNTGSNNVFIGNGAGEAASGSDKLYIDNTGINSPLIYGEFNNDLVQINGVLNIPTGTSGVTHFNYAADNRNYIRGETLFDNGDVGMGTTTPVYQLDVRDNISTGFVAQFLNSTTNSNGGGISINLGAETSFGSQFVQFIDFSGIEGSISGTGGNAVSYNTTSDGRLKTNVRPIRNALELVAQMKPSTYEWKSNGAGDMGFIAQELQEVVPYAVVGDPNSDPTEAPMGVDYGRLTPILTAAIQELVAENALLKKQIKALQQTLENQ